MEVELHFIKKDFLKYPIGVETGIYRKYYVGPFLIKYIKLKGYYQLPKEVKNDSKFKFIETAIGEKISLNDDQMKYCQCNKPVCRYNEDFKKIINDFNDKR